MGLHDFGLSAKDERADVALIKVGIVQLHGAGFADQRRDKRFGNFLRNIDPFNGLTCLPRVDHRGAQCCTCGHLGIGAGQNNERILAAKFKAGRNECTRGGFGYLAARCHRSGEGYVIDQ